MFFEEYLQEVRRARFHPRSLLRYARRAGAHARADMLANPVAVRSIWTTALLFLAAVFVASALLAVRVERTVGEEFFVASALGTLASFGLVTLGVGQMRNRDGYALSSLPLPCTLTLLRAALTPGLVILLLERLHVAALALFLVAGLSDVADGWVARRFRQVSRLGTILDPLVDIVFNFSLFAALGVSGLLPAWVMWVAAARYGVLLVGGAYLYLFHGPVRIAPTLFGRLSGVVMSVLVGVRLLVAMLGGAAADRVGPLTSIALGVLLSMGVAQGLVMGWYNLRLLTGEAQAARRVIGDVDWRAS